MVYAKSAPLETLLCHTKKVLDGSETLQSSCYREKIIQSIPVQYREYFWDALSLVCKAHDLGKVQTLFQNKILNACRRDLLPTVDGLVEIHHNMISPAFIHNFVIRFPKEIRPSIYQTIAFHHARVDIGKKLIDDDGAWLIVEDVIKRDVSKRLNELEDIQPLFNYELKEPSPYYLRQLDPKKPLKGDEFDFCRMLKGCLHRCDHSGSAHLDVEVMPCEHSQRQVTDYLTRKVKGKRRIWQYPIANSMFDKNVVLQAGTGSGKTEFALYWVGNEKTFYTLPMRTSVNAMYERLKETYGSLNNVGLLHADTALYILSTAGLIDVNDEDNGIVETWNRVDLSKQLSMPISVSTADQLFTSAFRYKGYEKICATLAYSKLIVDEIQSYDPAIVAIILKTLVDLSKIGCKFCIITATLPKMYLDYLNDKIVGLEIPDPIFKTTPRHRIRLLWRTIKDSDTIDLIINLNKKHGGVLVIVNTVKMAQEIKTLLTSRKIPANLLHSMFTYEDRGIKEYCVLKRQKGIWITTQIAEVSLNIDFNVMVTEISSIDSQIQRWGRVWRNREEDYTQSDPNIYITSNPSDHGAIYDGDLIRLTFKALRKSEPQLLSDRSEYELVQEVFGDPSLDDSQYKADFDLSLRILNTLTVDTKREAQSVFRPISNVNVIPSMVYDNYQKAIDEAADKLGDHKTGRHDKLRYISVIRNTSVSVPYHYLKEIHSWPHSMNHRIMIANMGYSYEMGADVASVPSASIIS